MNQWGPGYGPPSQQQGWPQQQGYGQRPPPKKSNSLVIAIGVVGGLGVLAIVGAANKNQPPPQPTAPQANPEPFVPPTPAPPPPQPEVVFTAVSSMTLFKDYTANEVAADQKYKGQKLLVSGKVVRVRKDAFGTMVVELGTSNEFMSTHAMMKDADASSVATLVVGQATHVACDGSGFVLGSPILDNCSVAKVTKSQ